MTILTNLRQVLTHTARLIILTLRNGWRHCDVQRVSRYIPVWEQNQNVIDMHAVEADAPLYMTAAHEDDEMSNYYTIIRCAQCNAMIQLRREGSKSRIRRICTACQKRLRGKQKAA